MTEYQESEPYEMGLYISCRVYFQAAEASDIWCVALAFRKDISGIGVTGEVYGS